MTVLTKLKLTVPLSTATVLINSALSFPSWMSSTGVDGVDVAAVGSTTSDTSYNERKEDKVQSKTFVTKMYLPSDFLH